MRITSSAFEEGEKIPTEYTCQGEDKSPPLEFHDIPKEAVTLALIMDDPDVPEQIRKDRMWVHWVVYNIDPKTRKVAAGTTNLGLHGENTGGKREYMGPCPPDREHRYFFKLYAIDKKLLHPEGLTKEMLLQAISGHTIETATLMGRYEKH